MKPNRQARAGGVRRALATGLVTGLVAALLALVPAAALAAFSDREAPAVRVGTAKLVAPTALTGTYTCSAPLLGAEKFTASVTGFADGTQLAGVQYVYQVLVGTSVQANVTSTSRTQAFNLPRSNDFSATTWTLTVHVRLGTWTGPAYAVSRTCPVLGSTSGSL